MYPHAAGVPRRPSGGARRARGWAISPHPPLLQKVPCAQARADSPLLRLQPVRDEDGPPLPMDQQLRRLLQLPLLPPLPSLLSSWLPSRRLLLLGPLVQKQRARLPLTGRADAALRLCAVPLDPSRALAFPLLARLLGWIEPDDDRVLLQPIRLARNGKRGEGVAQSIQPRLHRQLRASLWPLQALGLLAVADHACATGRRRGLPLHLDRRDARSLNSCPS
mmetsp:Transcript_30944/g.66458  ORF Transcript_30944/g.66458 Transcript_30944/m.66458 type:complete len:221 (+) Transcript_30944:309-971(+)